MLTLCAQGLMTGADYSGKKTTLVLFINGRPVECSPLKRAVELMYSRLLPKAAKPFLFLVLPSSLSIVRNTTKHQTHRNLMTGGVAGQRLHGLGIKSVPLKVSLWYAQSSRCCSLFSAHRQAVQVPGGCQSASMTGVLRSA